MAGQNKNLKFNMADTCWKNFEVIWVEVQLQKKNFFFFFKKKKKKNKVDMAWT